MLARLVINLTSDQLKTGRKPGSAQCTHSWCLKPDNHRLPCPPITFSTGPEKGKVARMDAERGERKSVGRDRKNKGEGAKSFRGTALGVRHRERERGEEGGRE